jgi:hypothetical protein
VRSVLLDLMVGQRPCADSGHRWVPLCEVQLLAVRLAVTGGHLQCVVCRGGGGQARHGRMLLDWVQVRLLGENRHGQCQDGGDEGEHCLGLCDLHERHSSCVEKRVPDSDRPRRAALGRVYPCHAAHNPGQGPLYPFRKASF